MRVTHDVRLHPSPEPGPERGPHPGAVDEHAIPADPTLVAAGWTRRSLADPARAAEMIELYRSLGFEAQAVELEPEDFGPSCLSCASILCRSYVMIYTRRPEPRGEAHGSDAPSA
jgi:hypothetical protein